MDFLVIHWRGTFPIRVRRLINPTAIELYQEQHLYGLRSPQPSVQTLTGDEAAHLYMLMGAAFREDVDTTIDSPPPVKVPWQSLTVLSEGKVLRATSDDARPALKAFRKDGPEASGVMVSHNKWQPRNGKHLTPDEIDWSGFAGVGASE